MRPADRLRQVLAGELVDALEQLIEERINAREVLIDSETAAAMLGISVPALRMRVARGSVLAIRVGRRLRIPRACVVAARGAGYPDPYKSGAAPRERPAP